jgi:DNA replication protein DnaC
MNPLTQLAPTIIIPARMIACINCTHGLIDPPPLKRDRPLYQERLAQHATGHLRPCTCEAGRAYAAWLHTAAASERQHTNDLAALPRRMETQRQERIFQNAGIPARYAAYTISGFERIAGADPGKRDAIAAIRHYDQHGHALQSGEQRSGIMLWGAPGAGKTGSLSPLFTELVRRGATGLWLQYNQLMADMKKFEDGQVDARMTACQVVEYLFLDDLGDPAASKVATDYARDVLFRIIDYRTSRNMPIFITSNLSPQELADQFHQRIARRIISACATIHMGGKPLR